MKWRSTGSKLYFYEEIFHTLEEKFLTFDRTAFLMTLECNPFQVRVLNLYLLPELLDFLCQEQIHKRILQNRYGTNGTKSPWNHQNSHHWFYPNDADSVTTLNMVTLPGNVCNTTEFMVKVWEKSFSFSRFNPTYMVRCPCQ